MFSVDAVLGECCVELKANKPSPDGALGPNGAGKSTLVKAVSGVLPLNAGSVSRITSYNVCYTKLLRSYILFYPSNGHMGD